MYFGFHQLLFGFIEYLLTSVILFLIFICSICCTFGMMNLPSAIVSFCLNITPPAKDFCSNLIPLGGRCNLMYQIQQLLSSTQFRIMFLIFSLKVRQHQFDKILMAHREGVTQDIFRDWITSRSLMKERRRLESFYDTINKHVTPEANPD